jgi:hypothetical protein
VRLRVTPKVSYYEIAGRFQVTVVLTVFAVSEFAPMPGREPEELMRRPSGRWTKIFGGVCGAGS